MKAESLIALPVTRLNTKQAYVYLYRLVLHVRTTQVTPATLKYRYLSVITSIDWRH